VRLALALALVAQTAILAQSPAFRAATRLVVVHATVRNARGDLVTTPEWPRLSQLVHGAFAHRRKRLDNSLELAGLPAPPAALAHLRAEQLSPSQFLELL